MKKRLVLTVVLGLVLGLAGVVRAGDTATVAVSANVVGTCKFLTGGSVAFGDLDPSAGTDVNGTVVQPTFWCTKGSTYTITDDNGLNESGTTHQMKHATLADTIPYTFMYTAGGTGSGRNSTVTMNIASSVVGADYINVSAGGYADTVTLTIAP